MTAEKILVKWISSRQKSSTPWFYSFDLESEVPTYGRLAHQKVHTASTYSRVPLVVPRVKAVNIG